MVYVPYEYYNNFGKTFLFRSLDYYIICIYKIGLVGTQRELYFSQ